MRLAVLVNDFGELPIDADLIEAQDGDVISLSGGCVCCSYGDDLTLSLQNLQQLENRPDHVLIEASGVALPAAIGKTLSLNRAYNLQSIVVLADATTIKTQFNEKYVGDTVQRQLMDADLILLNKLDLLDDKQANIVKDWIDEICPNVPLISTTYSDLNPAILFESKFAERATATVNDSPAILHAGSEHTLSGAPHTTHASSLFSSIEIRLHQQVDAHALAARLADKQVGLIRVKGFVRERDNSLQTIQIVGRRWSVTPAPLGVDTGLVCIAMSRDLNEAAIRSLCEIESEGVT